MNADDKSNDPPFHLERGIPVFNTRLDDIEREQAEAKKRDKEYRDEQLRLDRRMVWFTGLLVLCTAIVGGINGWQAHIASRSADTAQGALAEIRKQLPEIKKSADAAHDSAIAAQQSADVASQNMYIDQRAWLFAMGASTYNPPKNELEVGKPFFVRVEFENTGKTPASDFWITQLKTTRSSMNEWFPKTVPKLNLSKYPKNFIGILMPTTAGHGGFSDTLITPGLSPEDLQALKTNRLHIFVHGKMSYCDVFNRQHWTTYCYHLLSGGAYAACENSNDVDRDDKPIPCARK